MENTENEQIGEMVREIIENGFSLKLFRLWKLSADSPPVWHVAIRSNELRETPELNSRCLKGETLLEAMTKARNVSKYIIDTSKPINQ